MAAVFACSADDAPLPSRSTKRSAPAVPPPSAASPPSGAALPEGLELVDAPRLLERARGARGLVVNAWASWCGSCREEIPLLLKLRQDFAPERIEFVFVSADRPQDFAAAVQLMRSLGGPLPIAAVAPGTLAAFKRALSPDWHGGIPATFLFDSTAKLRHLWEGPILEHEISPVLQGFLSGEAIDGVTRTAAPRQ